MVQSLLCKLGFHRWGRATFVDHGMHSSVRDWKQQCTACGKEISWVQPKGSNEKFYPVSFVKRNGSVLILGLGILVFLIVLILIL
ncbi:MAG: hypothetical protein ACMXYE_00555 [Candidatus Woesearchaeota archaeon]